MIETALVLPFLLLLAFNAINFGYFFFTAINVAAAPRAGVQYSILGFSTPSQIQNATAGPANGTCTGLTVADLTCADMLRVLPGPGNSSMASVQICTSAIGTTGSGASKKAACVAYGSGPFPPPLDADPEVGNIPTFVLHRVDVVYNLRPLIPGIAAAGLTLLPSCSGSGAAMRCRFHRQVSMRNMN